MQGSKPFTAPVVELLKLMHTICDADSFTVKGTASDDVATCTDSGAIKQQTQEAAQVSGTQHTFPKAVRL